MASYTPPKPGDRTDGMEWTGDAWAPVCATDDVPMTEFNDCAELCCPMCGESGIQQVRKARR